MKETDIHTELIARCRKGDREACYALYKNYSRAMYNTAFRITGMEEDAEDVLQEAFINAFRNLDNFRGEASFGSWLKRIVINTAINLIKKKRISPLPENEDWDVADEPAPEEVDGLTVERVKTAMAHLPDGYRTVLSLYLIEGYDHQEIAGILGITESTSKSQYNRAKQKLRNLLLDQQV